MPFRDKLRRVISRTNDSNDSTSSSHKSSSSASSRKNSAFYQPGETIPYKYRRPVAKEHKEKLDAFTFAGAWRRQSHQSQYSPMGSRAVSRRNSVSSVVRRPFAKRAVGSVGSVGSASGGDMLRPEAAEHQYRPANQKENMQPQLEASTVGKDFASRERGMDSPHSESPFSAEELTLALQRSNLEVPLKA